MVTPTPEATEEARQGAKESEFDTFITVYGGKKDTVDDSFKKNVDVENSHSYHTWISVSVLRRFGNLFSGSVESAGGATDLFLLLIISAILVGFFFLWQFVVFSIVILVLTVFSGGVALKFIKGTFIETNAADINASGLDRFMKEQISAGCFVDVKSESKFEVAQFTNRALKATRLFTGGIYVSLIVATVFAALEILVYLFRQMWITDLPFLAIYGIAFLMGIIVTDIGALYRRQLEKELKKGDSD